MYQPRSHQYPPQSSRRRRSSTHFRLLDLPSELRLLVIGHSLPFVNDVSRHWPAPIPTLLRVSKQFNADTRFVMTRWSPLHYVPDPTYLLSIPHPGPVKVENICLSMFHDARIGVLRSGHHTQTPADDHQDLILTWTANATDLPSWNTIQTIVIDATPAPGWLRYGKPHWISNIINDKAVADRFIYEHIGVIADLASTIAGFYQSLNLHPSIELAGLYGERSSSFPEFVQSRCQSTSLHVPFTGIIIPRTRRRHNSTSNTSYHNPVTTSGTSTSTQPTITIDRAIQELYSPHNMPASQSQSQSHHQRQKSHTKTAKWRLLNHYTYTPTTRFLFENCFDDDENRTMYVLERLTDFAISSAHASASGEDGQRAGGERGYIDISIPDFAQGSLVCSLAKDLGLGTTPRSSWRRREIRVFRKTERFGRTRGLRSSSESLTGMSSLFSFLLMSAAVVMFVGILSSDSARRRRR